MSLAEIEQQVFQLAEPERRQFVAWFYENEDRILPLKAANDDGEEELSPQLMEELLRRRRELDDGNVQLYSVEEVSLRVKESLDEYRRTCHERS